MSSVNVQIGLCAKIRECNFSDSQFLTLSNSFLQRLDSAKIQTPLC